MIILTAERQRRGWSQAELARRAQINANTVSLIESARFKPYGVQLAKIARVLNWPAQEASRLLDPVTAQPEHQESTP
jgi:ribosome-binding protein aMBF1 (putative translation factor)